MLNQVSMRHLALLAIFTVAFSSLAVTVSQAAVKVSGGSYAQASWLPPGDAAPDGCTSDGDPDNPTVDHPQSRGNSTPGGVDQVEQVRLGYGDGGGVAIWWSRLLQLIGIR